MPNEATNMVEVAAQTGGPGTGLLDLVVPALVNDGLEVDVSLTTDGTRAFFDVATWISGAAVNWIGQSAGAVNVNNGWLYNVNALQSQMHRNSIYLVQAGDIAAATGLVTLRLMGGGNGGTSIVRRSVTGGVLTFTVKNLGPMYGS